MVVLVTCKNEEDPLKNKGARVATTFSHYKSMGIFPDAQGQLTPQSEVEPGRNSNSSEILLIRDIMVVLVIPKNEEDPIKNEAAREATTFSPL